MQKTKIIIALFCFAQPLTAAAVVTSSVNAQYCIGAACTPVTNMMTTEPNGDWLQIGLGWTERAPSTSLSLGYSAMQAGGFFFGNATITVDDIYTVLITGGAGSGTLGWYDNSADPCLGTLNSISCVRTFPASSAFTYGVPFDVPVRLFGKVFFGGIAATGLGGLILAADVTGNSNAIVSFQDGSDPPPPPVGPSAPEPSCMELMAVAIVAWSIRRRVVS